MKLFRISDFDIRISDFDIRISDFDIRISNFDIRISDFDIRISDFDIRISDLVAVRGLAKYSVVPVFLFIHATCDCLYTRWATLKGRPTTGPKG